MSTPATPPGQQPPAMPNPEDAAAIFTRAQQAAERAETAAQRLEAAQQGAAAETQSRFPDMPAEVLQNISKATADMVVQTLDSRYELAGQSPPPGTAPPAAGAAPTDAQPGAAGSPDTPATPPAEPPQSIARRILGY